MVPGFPEVAGNGSNLTLNPLFNKSGLVGYWPMDEGGGSVATDQSGNGNNGTWNGTQAGSSGYYSGGKVGSYTGYFNGSNDYVATNLTLTGQSSFSATAWVNAAAGAPTQYLLGQNIVSECWVLALSGGGNSVQFRTKSNSTVVINGTALPINTWHFIAGIYDGSNMMLYVDGVLSGTSTQTGALNNNGYNIYFGARNDAQVPFNGSLDDIRIYNRALSAAEVTALYNAEK